MHETSADPAAERIEAFIARWERSASAERANYQSFLIGLCKLLGVTEPEPAGPDDLRNAYVFERAVTFDNGDGTTSAGRIDLYKRGSFVLEAKQGSAGKGADDQPMLLDLSGGARKGKRGTAVRGTEAWTAAMLKAKAQAERYVRALPASEGNPPSVIVVDVGHTIELYADFSRLGKTYTPFSDPLTHRLRLADLARPEVRERLAKIWTDPLSLDPSRHSARVTREVAEKLALVARSLEMSGHDAELAAEFLMRCLFTFFAEDARLIDRQQPDEQPFTQLLRDLKGRPDQFVPMVPAARPSRPSLFPGPGNHAAAVAIAERGQ